MASTTDTANDGRDKASTLRRGLTLIYGVATYFFFLGVFLYLIGWVGNWVVPKAIDSGTAAASTAGAITINVLLMGLFAVQHTIMARPTFKKAWTKIVPVAVERSTFVLVSSAILALLAWQWRPLPTAVWQVDNPLWAGVLIAASLAGWAVVLISTFLIDHLELFGFRQVVLYALDREAEAPEFKERLFYHWVRHPLMLGFLIAFWATPLMSQGHLLFAVVVTIYILIALQIEERTLVYLHGESYEDYKRRVPMLVPFVRRR